MTVALLNGLFCAALLIACTTPAVLALDVPSSSSVALVRVQNDAVFNVQGPVCSGDAAGQPLGWSCPKKGDSAIDSCTKELKSFSDGANKCVAPVDAECRVIAETGAWGCVWPIEATTADSSSSSTLATPSESTPTPTHSLRSSTSTIALSADATTGSHQTTSSTLVWIGSAAAGAVAVAAIVAAVIISKKRKANAQRKPSESGLPDIVITPENAPVVTPKTSKTVFVYTAHI